MHTHKQSAQDTYSSLSTDFSSATKFQGISPSSPVCRCLTRHQSDSLQQNYHFTQPTHMTGSGISTMVGHLLTQFSPVISILPYKILYVHSLPNSPLYIFHYFAITPSLWFPLGNLSYSFACWCTVLQWETLTQLCIQLNSKSEKVLKILLV